MGLLDFDEEDTFWKNRRKEAWDAMHDREVGYFGAIQASKDYKKLSEKLNKSEKDTP